MTGAVVSTTVIICDSEIVLPHSSVIVHVLVMVWVLPHEPSLITSSNVTCTEPHMSSPVAVPVANGSVDSEHSTVVSAGMVMVGGVLSIIEIV